ncbi:MAG: OmpA family protein [Nitrospirae bacterium]|nr:OmpA family protein [Nitrospirota bacterium]
MGLLLVVLLFVLVLPYGWKDRNLPPEPARATQAIDHPPPSVPRVLPAVHAAGRADPSSLAQEIRTLLLKDLVEDSGHVRTEPNGVVIVLGERVLFDPGKAALIGPARPALDRLADFLTVNAGYEIVVEGHTDNTPIHTAAFPSNWELSLARANSVVQALIVRGVPPGTLSAKGHGEHRPVIPNDTNEGRAANRRVEIRLVDPGHGGTAPAANPGQSPFVSL